MEYVLYGVVLLGLFAGAAIVARSPSFWVGITLDILRRLWPFIVDYVMNNRPKEVSEWKEWRELSRMKPGEMSAKQKARLAELKKLNAEYRKND